MYGKPNRQYYNMTEAEILRSLSDNDVNKFARRGAPNAIMEQAYRHNLRDAWEHSCDGLSDFEAAIRIEAECRSR